MKDLLRLLEENARYSAEELAAMLGVDAGEVRRLMEEYEREGVIRGYKTIVDWEKAGEDLVSARIEVKVTPKRDTGFDELAEFICGFEEVQSLYLISGGYDLALTIVGKSFKDIANFVSYTLAPIDSVQSTATHFVLRKYKDRGAPLCGPEKDERGVVL